MEFYPNGLFRSSRRSYCSGPCTNLSSDAVVNEVMQPTLPHHSSQPPGVQGAVEVALEREGSWVVNGSGWVGGEGVDGQIKDRWMAHR